MIDTIILAQIGYEAVKNHRRANGTPEYPDWDDADEIWREHAQIFAAAIREHLECLPSVVVR